MLTNWSDGHNHIYLYSYDESNPGSTNAKLERQLTKGDFEVGDVYRVDHAHKVVYYASNEGNVLEQQIWQVSFDGERKQLSSGAGIHQANFLPPTRSFTDKFSTRMDPADAAAVPGRQPAARRSGRRTRSIPTSARAEALEVKAHDGTTLYATLLLPANAARPGERAADRESLRRARPAGSSE